MKTVHIVSEGRYEDYRVVAIAETKELAEEIANHLSDEASYEGAMPLFREGDEFPHRVDRWFARTTSLISLDGKAITDRVSYPIEAWAHEAVEEPKAFQRGDSRYPSFHAIFYPTKEEAEAAVDKLYEEWRANLDE